MLVIEYYITFKKPVQSSFPALHVSCTSKVHISSSWAYTRADMEEHKTEVEKVKLMTWTDEGKEFKEIQDPFNYQGEDFDAANNWGEGGEFKY